MSLVSSYYAEPVLRKSLVLTNGYVAGTVFKATYDNQVMLYVAFTKGNLGSAELKVEFSDDGVTYYQQSFSSVAGGTDTRTLGEYAFTANGAYRLAIPVKDNYVKVSVKGTGDVTNSLMAVTAIRGIV